MQRNALNAFCTEEEKKITFEWVQESNPLIVD